MAITRFEIEKFDGETNFNLWQVWMMAILVQSGLKKEVLMEKTSSALWKRLETLYATKSLANRLVLKQRLFTFRMNESELLRDHISQLIALLNDLKNIEETLIYGRDKLSFEDVKGHLLSREKLDNELHLDSKTDRQASILVALKKRDKRCRYCKKLGHIKADCYKLRNKRAAESNNEDVACANLADGNGDDFLLVSTSNNSKLTSEWILDSGCSFHMCPNREWFSTYSSVEGGVMRMGNDSSSKVVGIGTVKIKMHDGTIRTLSDVRYVPDLRKNLISLSILDLKGCRINIESSGIKVSRGALVLLKGFEKLGHYVRENQTRVSFDLTMYRSKARSLPVSMHKFDSVNSLHSSRWARGGLWQRWRCGNMSQGGDLLNMTPIFSQI
ncbi:hypothetical protein CXB51_028426 [Gossypium anomalum]|uniref:Retrovirus-related Pol polyprotein from transposon TNT 1-94-like beta-barrel domain-containing protein n=1 Tax=Gossypium anomalum TaxID=47600 RepID=A0A8J5Y6D2_9ROSI|nr:hypothetical protein CXB51_028426 [Gossypium anomalum]